VGEAVTELAGVFFRHARFLRAVVLISGAHPEVKRRGAVHARRLGDEFTAVLMRAADRIAHPDPAAAAHACFTMLFSTLVLRIAYGAGFTAPATTDDAFTGQLVQIATGYLLNPPVEHGPASR
jgi:hypothetical protein